jgi:hypothetical protein
VDTSMVVMAIGTWQLETGHWAVAVAVVSGD